MFGFHPTIDDAIDDFRFATNRVKLNRFVSETANSGRDELPAALAGPSPRERLAAAHAELAEKAAALKDLVADVAAGRVADPVYARRDPRLRAIAAAVAVVMQDAGPPPPAPAEARPAGAERARPRPRGSRKRTPPRTE